MQASLAIDSVQAHSRRQQALDELCAATLRAVSARRQVHYKGALLFDGAAQLPSFAPHLHPHAQLRNLDADAPRPDLTSFRGAADGVALRLRHSDAALHRSLRPAKPMARRVFDLLEQYRAESLVSAHWPGVRRNMRERFSAWSRAFVQGRLHESAQGILLLTVAQVCRARITGDAVDEALQDLLEATRFGLVPRIGHALAGLRRNREKQADFAVDALAIAAVVAQLAEDAAPAATPKKDTETPDDEDEDAWLQIWVDFEAGEESGLASALVARDAPQSGAAGYRAFTTAYDREASASSLVRAAQLTELRATLDIAVAQTGINPARLARALQALLAQPLDDGWDSGQESGLIDGRRLAQLVSSPTERRLFRTPHQTPVTNCVVGLLLDCSGSMKQHMAQLAPLLDVLLRALELAGAHTELLGYTTGAWNGGRVMRDWRRAGKPAAPGRLNELCHIVFKDSDTPWRRGKSGVAALLKPDLFRECVDGEALRWAAARLAAVQAQRRILLVFSDGSPMDGATVLANDTYYLDRDLQATAAGIERAGQIELRGVGLGLDLSAFYARSVVLDMQNHRSAHTLGEILTLLRPRA